MDFEFMHGENELDLQIGTINTSKLTWPYFLKAVMINRVSIGDTSDISVMMTSGE